MPDWISALMSGTGGARSASSNLEASSRSDYKTDGDSSSIGGPVTRPGSSVRSSETDVQTVGPKRGQRLKAKVEELKAQLEEEKLNNEQTQAQSKHEFEGHLHQALTQLSTTEKELEEAQTQLLHQQKLQAQEGTELRKANVLVRGMQQEMKNLQADHERLQGIVDDRNAVRLLAGGINIQAACPTLPEIEAHIRRALTVTVSEWIEEVSPALSSALPIPVVLSMVFSECRELVDDIVRKNTAFIEGGVGSDCGPSTMDEANVDVFRQHIRRHHRTLFPLTGETLSRACREVVSKVGHVLAPSSSDTIPSRVGQELISTKLDRVVAEYLPILVAVTLQHPPVVFSNEMVLQRFDPAIHAESVDGAAVSIGQACFIVFPALLVEHEGGQGFQPVTKPYILPVVNCQ